MLAALRLPQFRAKMFGQALPATLIRLIVAGWCRDDDLAGQMVRVYVSQSFPLPRIQICTCTLRWAARMLIDEKAVRSQMCCSWSPAPHAGGPLLLQLGPLHWYLVLRGLGIHVLISFAITAGRA